MKNILSDIPISLTALHHTLFLASICALIVGCETQTDGGTAAQMIDATLTDAEPPTNNESGNQLGQSCPDGECESGRCIHGVCSRRCIEDIDCDREGLLCGRREGANLCSTACNADTQCPDGFCLLYTSPSPRDQRGSRMPSSA